VGQEDEAMLAAFMRRQWSKVFGQHIACSSSAKAKQK
jgi:hypothetical protein